MPVISIKGLTKRFANGSIEPKTLDGWVASERKHHHNRLPAKDSALLADLLRTYHAGLKASARNRAKKVLRNTAMRRAYSALELRAKHLEIEADGWPATHITDGLDLSHHLEIPDRNGKVVRVGGDGVEGLQANIRRIRDASGQEGLELHAGLRSTLGHDVTAVMLKAGAKLEDYAERWGVADATGRLQYFDLEAASSGYSYSSSSGGDISRALVLRGDGWDIHYFPEEIAEQAMRGDIQVRAFGEDQAQQQKHLQAALKAIEALELTQPPTLEAIETLAKMHLLWQAAPKAAEKLSKKKQPTLNEIDTALKKAKVPPDAVADVRFSEVFPGYLAPVSASLAKRFKAQGVEALVHSTSNVENAARVLLTGGLLATTERLARGIKVAGMSSDTDLDTGGADYAFTRILTDSHRGQITTSNLGSFVFLLRPEVLGRTDWFGYPSDTYGSSAALDRGAPSSALLKELYPDITTIKERRAQWKSDKPHDHHDGSFLKRPTGKDLVTQIRDNDSYYSVSNEVMLRAGVALRDIEAVLTGSESNRKKLLDLLEKAGVKKINGVNVAKFVRVQKHVLEKPAKDIPDDGYYV